MPPESAEVKRWLSKAEHDRMGAEVALAHSPPLTDIAAFHCQQAVEKLLKAYLVDRRQSFERTHDLVELLGLCTDDDASFGALRGLVEPLTPYAVRFPYPGSADPSVEQVQSALEVVRRVLEFVVSRLGPDSAP